MKITVYTISDCQFSKQEKEFLQKNNLPFEEKNLETNKDFLTEMLTISNNFAGTPVTKIDKDDGTSVVLKGFTQEEFEKELNIQPQAAQTAPAEAAPAAVAAPTVTTPDQAVADQTAVADGSAVGDMNQVQTPAAPVMDPAPAAAEPAPMAPMDLPPAAPATPDMPAAPASLDPALPQTPSIDTTVTPDLPPVGEITGQPVMNPAPEPVAAPPAPVSPSVEPPAPVMPAEPAMPAAPVMPAAPEPAAPPVVPTTEAQAPAAPAAPQNDQALNDILSSLQAKVGDTSVDPAKQQ